MTIWSNSLLVCLFVPLISLSTFTFLSWSFPGRCFEGATGGEGAVPDQEDQAATGPDGRKEHTNGRDQRHEGHAGCQGEEG